MRILNDYPAPLLVTAILVSVALTTSNAKEFNLWPTDPAEFPCRNWLPLEPMTSDQGSLFENSPFRGSKRIDTLCEGGARVPFFVNWPGVTPTGAINTSVIQTTDMFPTLVELTGGDPATYDDLDGVSLLPILQNNSVLERGEPIYAYRAHEDLYVSVRKGPWKLLVYRSGKVNLYKVEEDRYEQNDLAGAHPEKVKGMLEKLIAWEQKMDVEEYSGVQ